MQKCRALHRGGSNQIIKSCPTKSSNLANFNDDSFHAWPLVWTWILALLTQAFTIHIHLIIFRKDDEDGMRQNNTPHPADAPSLQVAGSCPLQCAQQASTPNAGHQPIHHFREETIGTLDTDASAAAWLHKIERPPTKWKTVEQ